MWESGMNGGYVGQQREGEKNSKEGKWKTDSKGQ